MTGKELWQQEQQQRGSGDAVGAHDKNDNRNNFNIPPPRGAGRGRGGEHYSHHYHHHHHHHHNQRETAAPADDLHRYLESGRAARARVYTAMELEGGITTTSTTTTSIKTEASIQDDNKAVLVDQSASSGSNVVGDEILGRVEDLVDTTTSHQQNRSNSNNSKMPVSSSSILNAVRHLRPPCLPRELLPPPSFVDNTLSRFSALRDVIIEVRATLSAVEDLKQQYAEQGLDVKKETKRIAKRRERDNNINNTTANQNSNDKAMASNRVSSVARNDNQVAVSSSDAAPPLGGVTAGRGTGPSVADAAASAIIEQHLSERLFRRCVPSDVYAGDRRWDNTLMHLTRPSAGLAAVLVASAVRQQRDAAASRARTNLGDEKEEEDVWPTAAIGGGGARASGVASSPFSSLLFVPIANVSLLSRLTAGMALSLLRAAVRRFLSLAPNRSSNTSSIIYSSPTLCFGEAEAGSSSRDDDVSATTTTQAAFRVAVHDDASENNNSSSSGQPHRHHHPRLRSLLLFLAHLSQGAAGTWLFAALASVELPLTADMSSSLQEVLRTSTETLTLIFELRPDLASNSCCFSAKNNDDDDDTSLDENRIDDASVHLAVFSIKRNNNNCNTGVETALDEEMRCTANAAATMKPATTTSVTASSSRSSLFAPTSAVALVELRVLHSAASITRADVRLLMSIVAVVGKFFGQANRALLPL